MPDWLSKVIAPVAFLAVVGTWIELMPISKPTHISPKPFAGCYKDPTGNSIELTAAGKLKANDGDWHPYAIQPPVGGKHGYLIDINDVRPAMTRDRLSIMSGSEGFFWPITAEGDLTLLFAPDSMIGLHRVSLTCS